MNATIALARLKHHNLLFVFHRLMSSAALPGPPPVEYAPNRIRHDPVPLLGDPTNLRGLTLSQAKATHALFLKSCVMQSNIYAANNLIDAYAECSRMDYAHKLFDEIPMRNSVTWNLMILGFNKNCLFGESWRFFCLMHSGGVYMDDFAFGTVLSGCGALPDVACGVQVYGFVMKNGFFSDGYVRAGMIDLFSKCCRLDDALRVLHDVHCENVVCWNAIVSGAVKNTENWLALQVFTQMCHHGSLNPNAFTFSSVLTACASVQELELGKSIHARVIKVGSGSDVFVGTSILDMYAKSGAMCDAIKHFEQMPIRNVVSWTAVISGFVQKGNFYSAFRTLTEMHKKGEEINSFTVSNVLSACVNPSMFGEALQIHCWILKNGLYVNPVVKASLINTYSKVGAVDLSEIAFAETRDLKQVGIWANMISALVHGENYEKAVTLFQRMLKEGIPPDKFSVSSILSIIDSLSFGREVHGYTLKVGLVFDVSVGSSVFTMYSRCGNLEDSLKAFNQLDRKDNVSWTSMIAGFAEHGYPDRSVKLFREMGFDETILDDKTLTSVLNVCSSLRSLTLGREIHGFALRHGSTIEEALVNMYSKCGDLNSARTIFKRMPIKAQVTWSSLISGFSQKGQVEEALRLLQEMLSSDVSVDAFTLSSVLETCIGTQLHAYIEKMGLESEASVGSSLIMMYSKSGEIDNCDKVFRKIIEPDKVSWTTMIASYAHNGKGLEALELFDLMKKSGIEPDGITFSGVLSACSHAGLVEEGYFHVNSMIRDYKIEPGQKHYACVVDMLGRAGKLEEAKKIITDMPVEPDTLVWETLLAACKVHGDHEVGKVAAEKIMELEPSDAGAYVMVSNMCAEKGEWDRVVGVRSSMKEIGVRKKEPGWSFV